MAKSTYGVHPATVVWGKAMQTRAAAADVALEKCHRMATAPGQCRVTDCWQSTAHGFSIGWGRAEFGL